MLKVEDVNKSNELSGTKTTKKIDGESDFASYLNIYKSAAPQDVRATTAVASADAIFATQMITDEEKRQIRNKTLKKANDLLEKLEEIRDGLLVGEMDTERLIEISRFTKQNKISCDDDRLNEILAEIELRVEVELAKITK